MDREEFILKRDQILERMEYRRRLMISSHPAQQKSIWTKLIPIFKFFVSGIFNKQKNAVTKTVITATGVGLVGQLVKKKVANYLYRKTAHLFLNNR